MALTKPQTTVATEAKAEENLSPEGVQSVAEQAEAEDQQVNAEPQAAEESNESPVTEEGVKGTAKQAADPAPTELATQQAAKPPATNTERTAAAASTFQNTMAEAGFEGLTLGGLSFEQIRLPGEGQFLIGQDDEELGQEFDCVIQGTRSRFVVRQSDDQDAEMFYSYDEAMCLKSFKSWEDLKGLKNAEGVDMTETLQEWADDGYEKPVIKRYIETTAIMVNAADPDREGMMVILSIAPASVQKFAGYIAQQQFMKKQQPNEYVTRCIVGKKVKKDKNSFFPWTFKNVGPAPELF